MKWNRNVILTHLAGTQSLTVAAGVTARIEAYAATDEAPKKAEKSSGEGTAERAVVELDNRKLLWPPSSRAAQTHRCVVS